MHPYLSTSFGLGFIFLMTTLGGATVFLFKAQVLVRLEKISLGFAAGVMIAASIWSLLMPAIEAASSLGIVEWIPAALGFAFGALFMLGLDNLIPHLHAQSGVQEGVKTKARRSTLLFLAITLHNIPEGMAVGLLYALAMHGGDSSMYATATALAIGIGIQNFPEGAAVSLTICNEGMSKSRAFWVSCLSGVVEPIFGFVAVILAVIFTPLMPWLLSFAAGAMIYIVVEELIPEASLDKHWNMGTLSVIAGFLIMMILDLAFG